MLENENNCLSYEQQEEQEEQENEQEEQEHKIIQGNYFYEVCFKACSNIYSHDNSNIIERSLVIVQADRGYDIGVIYRSVSIDDNNGIIPTGKTIRKILSVITNEDKYIKYMLRSKVLSETHALTMSKTICSELKVGPSVDIITVEFQADRKKLTVYYKKHADVSLCKLIRKLHSAFKMRIWMENIDIVLKDDQNISETFKNFAERYFELVDIDPEVVNEEQLNANNGNNGTSNTEIHDPAHDPMVSRTPAFLQHTPQINTTNTNINNNNNNSSNINNANSKLQFVEQYSSNNYHQHHNVPSGNLQFLNRPGFNNLNSNTIPREVNYETQLNELNDNGYTNIVNNNNNNNQFNDDNIATNNRGILQRNNNNNNNNQNSNYQTQYGIKQSNIPMNRSEFLSYPDSSQVIGNLSQIQKNVPNTQRRNGLPSRQPIPSGYSDYLPQPPPSSVYASSSLLSSSSPSLNSSVELYQSSNRRSLSNLSSQRLLQHQQQQQQLHNSRYLISQKSSNRDIYDGYSHNYQNIQQYDEYSPNQSVYEDFSNSTPQNKYRLSEMEKYRYMNNRMEPATSTYNSVESQQQNYQQQYQQQQQQQQSSSNTFSSGISNSNTTFPYENMSHSNYNNTQQIKLQGGNNNPPNNRNIESFLGAPSMNSYLSSPSTISSPNTISPNNISNNASNMNSSYKNSVQSLQNYTDQSQLSLHHTIPSSNYVSTDKHTSLNSTTSRLPSSSSSSSLRSLHSYSYTGYSSTSPTFSEYSSYEWNSSDPNILAESNQFSNLNLNVNHNTNSLEPHGATTSNEYESKNKIPLSIGNSSFQHNNNKNIVSTINNMTPNSISYNNSYENDLNSSSTISMPLLGLHNNNTINANSNTNNYTNRNNINIDNGYTPEHDNIEIYIHDQEKYNDSHYQSSLKSPIIISNHHQHHGINTSVSNPSVASLTTSSNGNSNFSKSYNSPNLQNQQQQAQTQQQQYSMQTPQIQQPIPSIDLNSSFNYYHSSRDRSGSGIGINSGLKGKDGIQNDNSSPYFTNFDTT